MSSPRRIPHHIGIILDGNGRWARERFLPRVAGHKQGLLTLRNVIRQCRDRGVGAVSIFAFSSENWKRPADEVKGMMELLIGAVKTEIEKLNESGVRVYFAGDRNGLAPEVIAALEHAEQVTAGNSQMIVNVLFNYGGRWDILQAAERVRAAGLPFTEDHMKQFMALAHVPDPDMVIRTGRESRLSNFMLWQAAYSELYFSERYFPDFDEAALDAAIDEFNRRERRFGAIAETASPVSAA